MARPRKHSDEELLAGARAIIIEQGPSVSMATIADHVGLSQPALSKRFGGRQQLLLRALMPKIDLGLIERLQAGPTDAPMRDQLCDIGLEALTMLREVVPLMLTMRSSGLSPPTTASGTAMPHEWFNRVIFGFFDRAAQRGLVRSGDSEAFATVLIGSLQARAMMDYVSHGRESTQESNGGERRAQDRAAVRQLVDLLWHGLKP